jgi:uncharacterized cupredoxin-like copper-binding protein
MLEHVQLRVPAVAAGTLALVIGGCGGSSYDNKSSSKSSGGGASTKAEVSGGQTVKLEADADGGLYFEPKALKAKSGTVTLAMTNPKSTGKEHGIAVIGPDGQRDAAPVQPGQTAKVTLSLPAGRYKFFCNYDQHAKKGMKGTLTVQ